MISFRSVTKSFDGRKVLDDISFDIKEQENAVFLGASGSGKTTLLRLVAGFIAPDQGEIVLESSRIGFVFQDHRLLPWQTALDNITIVLEAKGVDASSARRMAGHWLDRLGLRGWEHSYPYQLSGGMAQRVSIARAFAVQPQIMLMDEPLSSLDREMADSILDELKGVLEEHRTTTLYVTHDLIEALDIGDRIFKLENSGLTELSITDRKAMLKEYIESRVKGNQD